MRVTGNILFVFKKIIQIVCIIPVFVVLRIPVYAQNASVIPVQNISFGAFSAGSSGGTVVISADGSRSVTGSVIPFNMGIEYHPAVFEIEAPPGTLISILTGDNITLSASNGSFVTLQVDKTEPAMPFNTTVAPPARTRVSIGGTLTVGSAITTTPGTYTGTFSITINKE